MAEEESGNDNAKKKDDVPKLESGAIAALVVAILLIAFAFLAPLIFVRPSIVGIDFNKTGPIGDTIGGIMNPFIAIAGALLTFLAFFIQFRANQFQHRNFREQLDLQQIQFRKSQLENQFYEMVRLHKENVNELYIERTIYAKNSRKNIQKPEISKEIVHGRRVFDLLLAEFKLCYWVAKKYFPESDNKRLTNEAYRVIWHGLSVELSKKHEFYMILASIRDRHQKSHFRNISSSIRLISKIETEFNDEMNFQILAGYSSQLAHYYRHLFQTVKFIANQPEDFLSYEEKRKYLRIMRAQLSNSEQVMLFYNWYGGFGYQWENETNKYFTDYRMIHNIYPDMIFYEMKLNKIFDITKTFKKEKSRPSDPLFEYQDHLKK
jgi:hypothetical protein